jgi:hypothetical protein
MGERREWAALGALRSQGVDEHLDSGAVISKSNLVGLSSLFEIICTLRSLYAHSYYIWRKDISDLRKTHSGSTLFDFF